LTELSSSLNRYKLKAKEQIEKALKKITKSSSELFKIQVIEDKQTVQRQIGPYRKILILLIILVINNLSNGLSIILQRFLSFTMVCL